TNANHLGPPQRVERLRAARHERVGIVTKRAPEYKIARREQRRDDRSVTDAIAPRHLKISRGAASLRQPMIWRSANSTFAGRSARRRMYHGYQASPYAIRSRTAYPSRASRRCSAARI